MYHIKAKDECNGNGYSSNKSDLLTNLNKQTDEIIISGALAQEIYHLKTTINRNGRNGLLVGSQGAGSFLTYLIEKLSYINSELSPEEQKLNMRFCVCMLLKINSRNYFITSKTVRLLNFYLIKIDQFPAYNESLSLIT